MTRKTSAASGNTPMLLPSQKKKNQSTWAKGPPQDISSSAAPSPHSQSPAPSHAPSPTTASHSRRPSALGQGVPIKGVSVPQVGSVRQGSAVAFGSIDGVAAPLAVSSKLPARPPISSTFSNVTSTSTTARPVLSKADIAKLFKTASSASSPPSSESDTSSPSTRPSNVPDHQPSLSSPQSPPQPPQPGAHQYTPFVPGIRQQQHTGSPRSPARSHSVPNGAGTPPRPMGGPGGPTGVPPQQVPMQPMHWSPYYYPADAHGQPASPWFYSTHAKYQQPHPPHTPHHPPHAPQPPPQYAHQPSGNIGVSSPLPTPSTATGPGIRPLNTNASIFVPTTRTPKAIVIKNENSTEVNLESLKIHSPQPLMVPIPPPPRVATSRRIVSVRIESEDAKRKRMERARLEQENEEAAEQAKRREQERKRKEEETKRKEKEEVERKEEVDQEWLRFEEDEWKRREGARLEEERKKAQEEKERAGREAEVAQLKADETQDILESPAENRAAPLSALATAKNIVRLQDVEYPEGIRGPREDLNKDAKDGKFRYDRGFLMQFMHICKEKPLNLSRLDILGIEPVDPTSFNMIRGGSGRHRKTSISGPLEGKAGASPSHLAMGQFSTPTSKLTTEERFMLLTGARSASVGGAPANMQFRATAMTYTPSQGGPGGHPMGSKRTRSKRGERRNETNKVVLSQQGQGHGVGAPGGMPILSAALEHVAPLEVSANRWVAPSTARNPIATHADSPELVDRKVRSLLNKLTMEKFDTISDQIIAWANKSENEKDGRTLIQVVRLVLDHAADGATWSEMYARLCRKMMERISPEVQDDGIRNTDGKPIAGGQLFRKYLLNRCQEDFERGWFAKETTAAAAAAKASNDQAIKAANDTMGEESELYSEEYYAAQKAKRQGLGLIKFIGELFKVQMLTERMMHECVKKLLGNVENPEEKEIESLCQLLKTAGQQLDVPKARAHMDVYFARMKELCKSLNVSPRVQFTLQVMIELRERRWVARGAVSAPTTIAAVHEAIAKEKAAALAQNYRRQISMSRGGPRRGGDRNAESGPDGWTTGGSVVPRPPKAGELSQFGKISKDAPMVMGPGNVFAGKRDTKRDSLSRTSSSSNMSSMLSQNPELAADAIAKASRPPSRRPSADFGQTGLPELLIQPRKKLKLLSRKRPAIAEETAPPASEEEPEAPAHVSEADVKKQIDEDVKEFFAVRNLEEADVYFTKLTEEHRFLLVDKLVTSALESKKADALLVGGFFAQAASKGQCSLETFEAGFMPMAELLDDIAIDAPNAFKYMAIMLKGAGFDKDDERLGRIAGKSIDSDELLQLVSSC
ncbi:hypothetical protein PAXINDRAFT_99504 [Paxillus involutus ATCC 200175]|uniref:MI domain-containing protein n=1 Tax=Paxillus involutus ATCC 200175 TaxID=664439 RepID=A0A0C9TJ68_PAXIN|nr:hypothetical protein PAXINDRAFT_99504 [Paxillus involutus ATCC 200175]